jgi:hypothetical protein
MGYQYRQSGLKGGATHFGRSCHSSARCRTSLGSMPQCIARKSIPHKPACYLCTKREIMDEKVPRLVIRSTHIGGLSVVVSGRVLVMMVVMAVSVLPPLHR